MELLGVPLSVLDLATVDRTRADELMITTRLFDGDNQIRTYELVAQLAGLGITATC